MKVQAYHGLSPPPGVVRLRYTVIDAQSSRGRRGHHGFQWW